MRMIWDVSLTSINSFVKFLIIMIMAIVCIIIGSNIQKKAIECFVEIDLSNSDRSHYIQQGKAMFNKELFLCSIIVFISIVFALLFLIYSWLLWLIFSLIFLLYLECFSIFCPLKDGDYIKIHIES